MRFLLVSSYLLPLTSFLVTGCGPKYTYPADKVPGSIEKICKSENNIDSTARVVGKTVGVLVYVDSIRDAKGQVPKEVHDTMGKVLQAVTRVALSTDLPLDFCTVVIRDRAHPMELIITRSIDDTRRANADAIGVEESINRTLFGQANYKRGDKTKDPFVLKEVLLENFLIDQIVQRVRFSYAKASKEETAEPMVLVDGAFEQRQGRRLMQFSVIALKAGDPRQTLKGIFKTADQVLQGYDFTGFDVLEIQDYMNRQKLSVDLATLTAFHQKKISEDELLKRCLMESQSIQEAFKLFGFNLVKDPVDKDAPSVAVATP